MPQPPKPIFVLAFYLVMVAAAAGLFLAVRPWGEALAAGLPAAPPHPTRPGGHGPSPLFHVLLALAAVVVAGRAVGQAFLRLGQPPVIGEVVAGILLGPSFLGHFAPEAAGFLLPPAVAPYLGVLSQIGVILYMFLVGLELNPNDLRGRAQGTIVIAHVGILMPFGLGTLLALYLYPQLATADVPFTSFALFLGVSLAVTAFPVLARILTDRGLTRTPLGVLALTSAAVGDATAWCVLAFVVAVAQARIDGAVQVFGWTALYVAGMVLLVRPILVAAARRYEDSRKNRWTLTLVLAGVLLSALATEAIGIHALFGAFLLGALIPHDSALARALPPKLEELVTILLLPAFFAFTGLRTEIGLVDGPAAWLLCGLIIVTACVGKFGGTYLAARVTGLPHGTSAALGVLMNTRGLMELIVLNVGLDLGILSPALFAMMVLMALATTLMTGPLLRCLGERGA